MLQECNSQVSAEDTRLKCLLDLGEEMQWGKEQDFPWGMGKLKIFLS